MHRRHHTPSAPHRRHPHALVTALAAVGRAADGHPRHLRRQRRAARSRRGLGITGGDIGWTTTSYSLIFGRLLLFGGRAADLLGHRRMFMTGLGVFTASSLVTTRPVAATVLFAARARQGLGAAMLSLPRSRS